VYMPVLISNFNFYAPIRFLKKSIIVYICVRGGTKRIFVSCDLSHFLALNIKWLFSFPKNIIC